jgi:Trypsin
VLLAGLLPGDAAAVTNAAKSTQMPWSVRLVISRIGSDEKVRCTGVALTQHWILTSAHCLEGRAKSTDEVQVDLGKGTTPLYPSGTGSYYNHPDHDDILGVGGDWGDDIGLVRLYGQGIFPELRAKIYYGKEVEDPSRWKEGAKIFFTAGYGYGSDLGDGVDCPDDSNSLGTKRLGRFKLTGNTDDDGILGGGHPIAVEARSAGFGGEHKLCRGDSGSPWAFSVGGDPNGEKFVFGLSGGSWLRSWPFHGGNFWANLLTAKMKWVVETAAAKGVPIVCPVYDRGSIYSYRQCTEGNWMVSRGASAEPGRLRPSSTEPSDVAFHDFDGDGKADAFRAYRGSWYVLYSDSRDWQAVKLDNRSSLRFGDFDGDGATDVFRSEAGGWYVTYASKQRGSWGRWEKVKTDAFEVDSLLFGDFDGDGATDAFRSYGGLWWVSYSPKTRSGEVISTQAFGPGPGTGAVIPDGTWSDWKVVKTDDVPVDSLAVADFDGDGADDIFRSTGGGWYVTFATKDRAGWGGWRKMKNADVALDKLAFGDFNGDAADDVFRATGGDWYVTYGTKDRTGWGGWSTVNHSSAPASSLAFADVNGDRRTDVILPERADPDLPTGGPGNQSGDGPPTHQN